MVEAKTYGLWNGRRAFMWHGHVHLMVGNHGSWVKLPAQTSDFEPFGPGHYNDPKYRTDLKRVGGEYVSAYSYGGQLCR